MSQCDGSCMATPMLRACLSLPQRTRTFRRQGQMHDATLCKRLSALYRHVYTYGQAVVRCECFEIYDYSIYRLSVHVLMRGRRFRQETKSGCPLNLDVRCNRQAVVRWALMNFRRIAHLLTWRPWAVLLRGISTFYKLEVS